MDMCIEQYPSIKYTPVKYSSEAKVFVLILVVFRLFVDSFKRVGAKKVKFEIRCKINFHVHMYMCIGKSPVLVLRFTEAE